MGVEVALFAVAVGATAYQIDKQQEAAEEAQEAAEKRAELESKRADLRTARDRARAVRAARAARASALAQGQTGAGQGGSGLTGAQANISSSLNTGLQFMSQNQQISDQISTLNLEASKTQADLNQDIRVAGTVASMANSAQNVFGE